MSCLMYFQIQDSLAAEVCNVTEMLLHFVIGSIMVDSRQDNIATGSTSLAFAQQGRIKYLSSNRSVLTLL